MKTNQPIDMIDDQDVRIGGAGPDPIPSEPIQALW